VTNTRQLLLYDASQSQGSWSEQTLPGEYAVHYSIFSTSDKRPYCSVFSSLAAAEEHARRQVLEVPSLRCTIYDHQGFIGAPLITITGSQYKDANELSPRFRRWAGSLLFLGGLALIVVDWRADFRLSWPAMIGSRLIIPGLILLCIEAALILHARLDRKKLAGRAIA
jgi:hypothetical protein